MFGIDLGKGLDMCFERLGTSFVLSKTIGN